MSSVLQKWKQLLKFLGYKTICNLFIRRVVTLVLKIYKLINKKILLPLIVIKLIYT